MKKKWSGEISQQWVRRKAINKYKQTNRKHVNKENNTTKKDAIKQLN